MKKSIKNLTINTMELIKKPLSELMTSTIITELMPVIEVTDSMPIFKNVNIILYNLDRKQYMKHCDVRRFTKHYHILTDDISYIISINNTNYIHVSTKRYILHNGYDFQFLLLRFIGPSRYIYRDKFVKKAQNMHKPNTATLITHESSYDIKTRTFDSIIIDSKIKNTIINRLVVWDRNIQWYNEHSLVHKIGILLYGDPGTGKSSVIRAISSMFNDADIHIISPNEFMKQCGNLVDLCRDNFAKGKVSIVVFEDIDTIVTSRDIDKSKYKYNDNMEQYMLLQMLDGTLSTDNTIYIATTNHKDKLDPALIRYGRFDIQAELKNFDYKMSVEFVKKFGYDENLLKGFNLTYPVQPVYLQNKIMEHYTNTKLNELMEKK